MSFNYLSTIYKSYSIVSAVQARLRLDESSGKIDQYLLVAKPNSIEVFYPSREDRIDSLFEIPLYAELHHINKIASTNPDEPDMIFLLTDDYKYIFCHISKTKIEDIKCSGELEQPNINTQLPRKIIMYQPDKFHIDAGENKSKINTGRKPSKLTRDNPLAEMSIEEEKPADFSSTMAMPSGSKLTASVSKSFGFIIIYGNENDLKVIPWKESGTITVSKHFSVRIEDSELFDIVPLYKDKPVGQDIHLGLLLKDELSYFYKEIVFDEKSTKAKVNTTDGWVVRFAYPVYKVLSLSNGGFLAFLENNISLYKRNSNKESFRKVFSPSVGECALIPGFKDFFFFSDRKTGSLYLLSVLNDQSANMENFIKTVVLGQIGEASCLCYLGDKKLFVGSEMDNSCFVKITESFTGDSRDPYIQKIASLGNLGVIWSFDVLSGDTNQKILTVSPDKNQPLNVFHIGAGLEIETSINFTECPSAIFVHENVIIFVILNECVVSFIKDHATGILSNEKFEILNNTRQLFSLSSDIILKIEKRRILALKIVFPEGALALEPILLKSYEDQIIKALLVENVLFIALNENTIVINALTIDERGALAIHETGRVKTSADVSAIAVSSDFKNDQLFFYNCWFSETLEVCNYLSPDSLKCSKNIANQEVHSMIIGKNFVLIGNKDGGVLYYNYSFSNDEGILNLDLNLITIFVIGREPVTLINLEKQGIFALSKNIAMLKISKERIEKVYINSKDIHQIAEIELNNKNYLLCAKEQSIYCCTVEKSQKYIISPFGKFNFSLQKDCSLQPEDVQIQSDLKIVAVAANSNNGDNLKRASKSAVIMFDQVSEDVINIVFIAHEIITCLFINKAMFLVGTEYEHNEKISGKVHLYTIISREKYLFCRAITFGNNVSAIKSLSENLFVIAVGQEIKVYEIKKDKYLGSDIIAKEICSKNISTIILNIDVRNNIILVSDPLKNLSLFGFDHQEQKLVIIGRETSNGKSILGLFYNSKILQTDNSSGLNMFFRSEKHENDLEKLKILTLGRINLGERLICGKTFPINRADPHLSEKEKMILCSEKGSLVGLIPLKEETYAFLSDLQEALISQYNKGFLCLDYLKWRGKLNKEHRRSLLKVIDGDLFKRFLDLPVEMIEAILSKTNTHTNAQELISIVDNIERNLFF